MVIRTNRYVFQVHICVIQVQPFEQALLLRCSCKQSKPIKVCSVLVCHKERTPTTTKKFGLLTFHYGLCIKSMTKMAERDFIVFLSDVVSLETNVGP